MVSKKKSFLRIQTKETSTLECYVLDRENRGVLSGSSHSEACEWASWDIYWRSFVLSPSIFPLLHLLSVIIFLPSSSPPSAALKLDFWGFWLRRGQNVVEPIKQPHFQVALLKVHGTDKGLNPRPWDSRKIRTFSVFRDFLKPRSPAWNIKNRNGEGYIKLIRTDQGKASTGEAG